VALNIRFIGSPAPFFLVVEDGDEHAADFRFSRQANGGARMRIRPNGAPADARRQFDGVDHAARSIEWCRCMTNDNDDARQKIIEPFIELIGRLIIHFTELEDLVLLGCSGCRPIR
jgi:hypothetical protein